MMLLGPDDPPPFELVNPDGKACALLVADHAGRAFPKSLGTLGVDPGALDRHVAYDIGIDAFARRLAERLDAPLLLHRYSRLILDPNRQPDDPTSICAISDGVIVPGNAKLTREDEAARADAFFHPYHDAIAGQLDRMAARCPAPALLSLHSFTPVMRGFARPWHVGVLWRDDGRIPLPLMEALRNDPEITVGDNQPYSGRNEHGYTIHHHAEPRGLPHVLIEMRQDLIAADEAAQAWADRMAGIFAPILADPALYQPLQAVA